MHKEPYEASRVAALVPMLESIANEIHERTTRLRELRHRIKSSDSDEQVRTLRAESAVQRRALRCARQELERLGCSIVGRRPLTLRIPGRVGPRLLSCVWQRGTPALRWA